MSKKKSIVVFVVLAVFIVAAGVLSVVSFPIGLYDYTGYAKAIKLGLDLSGGVSVVYEVVTTEADGTEIPSDVLDQRCQGAVESLQNLLLSKSYPESVVTYNKGATPTIRVEVPDVDDPERLFDLIGRPASLQFVNPDDHSEVYIEGKNHLDNAYVLAHETVSGKYAVGLQFNTEGAKKFAEVTKELSQDGSTTGYLTILVNGEVLMDKVSVSQEITGGNATISSSNGYTFDEAYDLSTSLQAGTFGVDLIERETRVLGPTLGENAIRNGLIAGAIGLVLVMIFMVVFYRKLGLLANMALLIYVELLLIFCAILPWVQLTLPGIAGIVLGIGMAVDANIIVFERTKDEFRNGKTLITAIDTGFKKGSVAVIDANITTLIGAVVLWVFGGSSIVGFAVTLFISIIISMFTALVVTRSLIKLALPFDSQNAGGYGLKREVANND